MRLKFVAGVATFFLLVAAILAATIYGLSLPSYGGTGEGIGSSTTPVAANNPIARENANTGTGNWEIPAGKAATTQIQAYADATSVAPGHALTFYVSTQKAGTNYFIDIYRLGWYGGTGGRLMITLPAQVGQTQGYYDAVTNHLIGCVSCHIDTNTGLIEANWQPSFKLIVPSDWTTGVYLAKLTDVSGMQTYVPFDVLGNYHSLYVAVTADTTYAAYNTWGGASLYEEGNAQVSEGVNQAKAVKVSFDRPYVQEAGSSQVLIAEADAIRWFERQGYDLSYFSSVDLHENPKQLQQHRAYISLGHDEYWTDRMRDGVEVARDKGVGLAFMGADAAYWQMRFETDSLNKPDRTIVCYKVATSDHDLVRDPLYGKDNQRVTARWRDPVIDRPENELIGIMFSDLTHQQNGFSWQVAPAVSSQLLEGTGLQPGQPYGCGLVGYEWDRFFSNGASPGDLKVIGTSPTRNDANKSDFSNTTYYIAVSGAMVFATGSIYWAASLDSYRLHTDKLCDYPTVVPGMQQLMANVMSALIVHHSSSQVTLPTTSTFSDKFATYIGAAFSYLLPLWARDDWMNSIKNFYADSGRRWVKYDFTAKSLKQQVGLEFTPLAFELLSFCFVCFGWRISVLRGKSRF